MGVALHLNLPAKSTGSQLHTGEGIAQHTGGRYGVLVAELEIVLCRFQFRGYLVPRVEIDA
jgi:hypothetical protein